MSRSVRLLGLALLTLLVTASSAQAAKPARQYFVSLGDSYAVGYQADVGHTTHNGPADQLVPLAAKRGYRFKLVNLGCGGATTGSMLAKIDCPRAALAPGAAGYPGKTQVQAAAAFLRKHRGKVGLVTISISGNDVTSCIPAPEPLPCVSARMKTVKANLAKILGRLRAAGGAKVRIVGSTYPDVVLGAWVRPAPFGDGRFALATNSLTSFAKFINPGLKRTYGAAGAKFVDVTRATGAYGPFTTVQTKAYGLIPAPVAKVCKLTFFCSKVDIHMTTAGYHIIAKLEAATLPRRAG